MKQSFRFILPLALILFSCSAAKKINRTAQKTVLQDAALQTAHLGISIYEPATGKYWYNYQGDHYFVPASNTKLATCYAALKYLGDSLITAYYRQNKNDLFIIPNADPTVLHPDFVRQPLAELLKTRGSQVVVSTANKNNIEAWGSGWSWNDYDQNYVAERTYFPLYGNMVWLRTKPFVNKNANGVFTDAAATVKHQNLWVMPQHFAGNIQPNSSHELFQRPMGENKFYIDSLTGVATIPFTYAGADPLLPMLSAIAGKGVHYGMFNGRVDSVLHSQPTDSLLKPMMHRSDNFFAEQTLLMVSNQVLGVMDDAKIIDTLLKTDFKDLPQKPRWVDGSGLSRYNLFTPQDMVAILNKMKNTAGINRLKEILPTGNDGTLKNFYTQDSGFIFAKTGTLSGAVAISGFLYTHKNKLLIFSILVNNNQSGATPVRRAVEKFLQSVRDHY